MADIDDLTISITEMSFEQAENHINMIRDARMEYFKNRYKKKRRPKTKTKRKKKTKAEKAKDLLSKLSPAQQKALAKALTNESNKGDSS